MKKKILGLLVVIALATAGYAFAHDGGGMRGGMMGPGMMDSQGGGMMGSGMMGQGNMMSGMMPMMRMMNECGRMMGPASPVSFEPVTKERAEGIIKQHLENLRNPNLKAGKNTEETA